MHFLKPTSLKQPQVFDTTGAPGDTPKLVSVAPTDSMWRRCTQRLHHVVYCVIELSTAQRVKKLSDSVLKHATTNQKHTEIPSLLTTHVHTAQKMLPIVANKTNDISTIRRRIEYYSDDDDDDEVDDHLDSSLIMNDDHFDDDLTMNTPRPQILSSPIICDEAKSCPIKLDDSSSPKDPQDVLADKIASYVVASSDDDDSSPDHTVTLQLLITSYYIVYITQLLYYEGTSTGKIL